MSTLARCGGGCDYFTHYGSAASSRLLGKVSWRDSAACAVLASCVFGGCIADLGQRWFSFAVSAPVLAAVPAAPAPGAAFLLFSFYALQLSFDVPHSCERDELLLHLPTID